MDPEVLAPFIRTNFFPRVVVQSDLDFLREQGCCCPRARSESGTFCSI